MEENKESKSYLSHDKGFKMYKNGWIFVHVEGGPEQRGFQHGYLLAYELKNIIRSLSYLACANTGMDWTFFVKEAEKQFAYKLDAEYLTEIKSIAEGARMRGMDITWQEILAWNGYQELTDYWFPSVKCKYVSALRNCWTVPARGTCSAFIATGSATKNGKIILGQNFWNRYEYGQYFNVIMDLKPDKGNRFLMQTSPGLIDSFTHYFVNSAGLMASDTSSQGFSGYNPSGVPLFARARKASQHANSLDEFASILSNNSNGSFGPIWLVGDINTNEIMRFEQGLKFNSIDRKLDGSFIACDVPENADIRNLECSSSGYADMSDTTGARKVRLTQLMKKHAGNLDSETSKAVLADHYDPYLKSVMPSWRTIDGHAETDSQLFGSSPNKPLPYEPYGALDGKVATSELASSMSFWARWGNSSGLAFDANKFFKDNPQWSHLRGYIKDRPSQLWSKFSSQDAGSQ